MIDVEKEEIQTLSEAARSMKGGPVHVSTVHRWHLRGVKGRRLETFLRGGIRYTSREAISRFFSNATDSSNHAQSEPEHNSPTSAAIESAESILAADGI